MKFIIENPKDNLASIIRAVGYRPLNHSSNEELNCVRPLGGDYPRFHLYVKKENAAFIFNLHLDQKRPSYSGQTAHSGEYDGETVRDEKERILKIINRPQ